MGLGRLEEESMKKQSFKKRRITNALDGTEDEILWGNSDLGCLELQCDF
jgi:hypothetical protein